MAPQRRYVFFCRGREHNYIEEHFCHGSRGCPWGALLHCLGLNVIWHVR